VANTIGGGSLSYYWQQVKSFFRRMLLGNPLATSVQLEHRLPIYLALPVFASDALSSVAYATEEILIQFEQSHFAITPAVLKLLLYISFAIAGLIIIVGSSYRQAIHLYPSGGGSYSVSRDNLGVVPGLIAAASLTIDYILTVAVSVSSAVAQLASLPWFKSLHVEVHLLGLHMPLTVIAALLLVAIIMLVNLRGTKESGWTFAAPAYAFVAFLGVALVVTLIRFFTGNITPVTHAESAGLTVAGAATGPIGLFLILRAFASGSAALTGVEAVSNGVSAFEPPEAKNAAKTLLILMVILVLLFLGVGWAVYLYHIIPMSTETVIAQVAHAAYGAQGFGGVVATLTVLATLLVLMIAANTSFAGLPRLLALVAKDGYAPKTFINLGDRLVHTSGIIVLSLAAALLIIGFRAETNALIPLYAVGVFICFTLSQAGMVRKVLEQKVPGWQRMATLNALGCAITFIVALIQAVTKFTQGAWMVVLVLPILVYIFWLINRHYKWFDETMTVHQYDYNPLTEPEEPLTVLVLVSSDVHRGILEGLECGRAIAASGPNNILRAVHIEMDQEKTPRLQEKWEMLVEPYIGQKIRLDVVPSPYRWLIEPIMDYLDWTDLERSGDRIIVVLPEFETGSWITRILHNYTGNRLRTALLNRPHVTVVSSRFFMKPMAWRLGRGGLVY
jgi:amino acid transporter